MVSVTRQALITYTCTSLFYSNVAMRLRTLRSNKAATPTGANDSIIDCTTLSPTHDANYHITLRIRCKGRTHRYNTLTVSLCVFVYVCIHVRIYMCMCSVCLYVCMYVCVYVYVFEHACVYMCVFVCVCLCVCLYICLHTYMYKYIRMYIQTLF